MISAVSSISEKLIARLGLGLGLVLGREIEGCRERGIGPKEDVGQGWGRKGLEAENTRGRGYWID